MNSIETATELKVGGIFDSNGEKEIVIETHYEEERLIRFRTIRRVNGAIAESGYSVDREAVKTSQLFSGIYFGKKTPPFNASERYFELDKFFRERKK
jgi:hypothetical protein